MRKLDILFSDNAQLKIIDTVGFSDVKVSKSEVARAALEIGLNFLASYDNSQQESIFSVGEYISIMSKRSIEDASNVS